MSDIKKLQCMIDGSDNIVFLGGAGVSTESGIPDFRGKKGLYRNRPAAYSDRMPEYLLSSNCLYGEPEVFFSYFRENMNIADAKPNVTHLFLKQLEDEGKLTAIITQNIDGLHQKAGSGNVIEIHGTIRKCYCTKCDKEFDSSVIFESEGIPTCDCGGMIRPDVVLFGEMMGDSHGHAMYYVSKADVLIVAGTSLQVGTAASLIDIYPGKHLVIINDMPTPYDSEAELVIRAPLGEIIPSLHV